MVWQSLVYFLTNNTKNLWDSDDDVDDNLCGEMFIGTIASLWHLFKISFSNPWEGGGCFVDLDGKKKTYSNLLFRLGAGGVGHIEILLYCKMDSVLRLPKPYLTKPELRNKPDTKEYRSCRYYVVTAGSVNISRSCSVLFVLTRWRSCSTSGNDICDIQ